MKITSRPTNDQPCEKVVLDSIRPLYTAQAGPKTTYTLAQYGFMVQLVMSTLQQAKVIKDFRMQAPVEQPTSTYEHEKWVQKVGFTGDGKGWYTLELYFNFHRA